MQTRWPHDDAAGDEVVPTSRVSDALCRQLLSAVEQSPVAMVIIDLGGRIEFVNQCYLDIAGSSRDAVLGQTSTFLEPGRRDNAFYRRLWQALQKNGRWQGEISHRNQNGDTYPLWQSIAAVRDEGGKVQRYVAMFYRIDEREGMEAVCRQSRDDLTGAFNRHAFEAALHYSVCQAKQQGEGFALIRLDIDNFHVVNGRHGQEVGDEILRRLTSRIAKNLRSTDLLARWGRKEFTILVLDTPLRRATILAERLRRQVADRRICGLSVTASLGITAYRPGDNAEGLLARVDAALHRAQQAKGNRVVTLGGPLEEPLPGWPSLS